MGLRFTRFCEKVGNLTGLVFVIQLIFSFCEIKNTGLTDPVISIIVAIRYCLTPDVTCFDVLLSAGTQELDVIYKVDSQGNPVIIRGGRATVYPPFSLT